MAFERHSVGWSLVDARHVLSELHSHCDKLSGKRLQPYDLHDITRFPRGSTSASLPLPPRQGHDDIRLIVAER